MSDGETKTFFLDAALSPQQVEGLIDGRLMSHVGWGGRTRTVEAGFDLGVGVANRGRARRYGVRRALFDAAFGYVSGFRKRDIAYYVLTRSLSATVSRVVIDWEQRRMQVIAHIRPQKPVATGTITVYYPGESGDVHS